MTTFAVFLIGAGCLFLGFAAGVLIARAVVPASASASAEQELWREMIKVVQASILGEPEAWSSDGYRLTNEERGMSIWIANHEYGLDVEVSGSGGTVPLTDDDKKALWRVVQARCAAAIVNRFRDVAA